MLRVVNIPIQRNKHRIDEVLSGVGFFVAGSMIKAEICAELLNQCGDQAFGLIEGDRHGQGSNSAQMDDALSIDRSCVRVKQTARSRSRAGRLLPW